MSERPANCGVDPLVYSEAAAQKAAFSDSVQHPFTLWPTAMGVMGGVGALMFATVPIATIITLGGVTIGTANWAYRFFVKRDSNMQKYYDTLHERFEVLKSRQVRMLVNKLSELGCPEGSEQVGKFDEKIEILREILGKVLSTGELTYSRFMGTAETVFNTGIQNLGRVVNLLTSIRDIDREDLENKIKKIQKKGSLTKSDQTLLDAYQKRVSEYNSVMTEVSQLLAENEQAITAICEASTAAARIGDREAKMTPEEKMRDARELLDQMIARANSRPKLLTLLDEDQQKNS